MGTCRPCSREFSKSGIKLDHPDPAVLGQSQWGRPSIFFLLLWRWPVVIFFTILLVFTGTHYADNSIGQFWPLFITNWSVVVQTISCLMEAVCATYHYGRYKRTGKDDYLSMPVLFKISWILYNITNVIALIVTLLYWSAIYDGTTILFHTLGTHAINSIYVIINIFITGHPTRLLHFWHPVIFAILWDIMSGVYYAVSGEIIYTVVDYKTTPGVASALVLVLTFVVVPILHCIIFGLYKLRVAIFDAVTSSTKLGLHNAKPNGNMKVVNDDIEKSIIKSDDFAFNYTPCVVDKNMLAKAKNYYDQNLQYVACVDGETIRVNQEQEQCVAKGKTGFVPFVHCDCHNTSPKCFDKSEINSCYLNLPHIEEHIKSATMAVENELNTKSGNFISNYVPCVLVYAYKPKDNTETNVEIKKVDNESETTGTIRYMPCQEIIDIEKSDQITAESNAHLANESNGRNARVSAESGGVKCDITNKTGFVNVGYIADVEDDMVYNETGFVNAGYVPDVADETVSVRTRSEQECNVVKEPEFVIDYVEYIEDDRVFAYKDVDFDFKDSHSEQYNLQVQMLAKNMCDSVLNKAIHELTETEKQVSELGDGSSTFDFTSYNVTSDSNIETIVSPIKNNVSLLPNNSTIFTDESLNDNTKSDCEYSEVDISRISFNFDDVFHSFNERMFAEYKTVCNIDVICESNCDDKATVGNDKRPRLNAIADNSILDESDDNASVFKHEPRRDARNRFDLDIHDNTRDAEDNHIQRPRLNAIEENSIQDEGDINICLFEPESSDTSNVFSLAIHDNTGTVENDYQERLRLDSVTDASIQDESIIDISVYQHEQNDASNECYLYIDVLKTPKQSAKKNKVAVITVKDDVSFIDVECVTDDEQSCTNNECSISFNLSTCSHSTEYDSEQSTTEKDYILILTNGESRLDQSNSKFQFDFKSWSVGDEPNDRKSRDNTTIHKIRRTNSATF